MEPDQSTAEDWTRASDKRAFIVEKYKEYLLLKGEQPASIYIFCKEIGIEESEFYEHFNSFDQVADVYWITIFDKVATETRENGSYGDFSTREKLLTFYYNFFGELKKHRSYILANFKQSYFSLTGNSHFTELKEAFKRWVKQLLLQGISKGEVSPRSRVSDIYDSLFWYQFLFLLNFWRKDDSKGFQKTDAAIEKSVQLSLDLIEKNAIDSTFDFARFMFTNK